MTSPVPAAEPRTLSEIEARTERDDGFRQALLSDSEATLRKVEDVLSDFAGMSLADVAYDLPSGTGTDLAGVLAALHSALFDLIERVRASRGRLDDAGPEDDEGEAASVLLDVERRLLRISHLVTVGVERSVAETPPAEPLPSTP